MAVLPLIKSNLKDIQFLLFKKSKYSFLYYFFKGHVADGHGRNQEVLVIIVLCPEAMIKWRVEHAGLNEGMLKQWDVSQKGVWTTFRTQKSKVGCDPVNTTKQDFLNLGSHLISPCWLKVEMAACRFSRFTAHQKVKFSAFSVLFPVI